MKNIKNKSRRPRMIWNANLIAEDKKILEEFGLRRKREIWAAKSILREFRTRARELISLHDKKKEKELIDKLVQLGMLKENATLDDVLSLSLQTILNRRLQTLVFKRGIAKTQNQARQMIVHGHIEVDGRTINFPSYLIAVSEESSLKMFESSTKKFQAKEKPAPEAPVEKEGGAVPVVAEKAEETEA